MHYYLPAIGFGSVHQKQNLYQLLSLVEEDFTDKKLTFQNIDMDFCEYRKDFSESTGILLFGDEDAFEFFRKQYYFPYLKGRGITTFADVSVERRLDREAYVGICEDSRVGISLMFHLQNTLEYMRELKLSPEGMKYASVTFAALCESGTILFPVMKDEAQEKIQREAEQNRKLLVSAARSGDKIAMESLTLDDIDKYSMLSRRIITEDVFSIVETTIIPVGIECDRYSILGVIKDMRIEINSYTAEEIYIFSIEVNGLVFDLCVPVKKVIGEPAIGRRFKGDIWLQGRINFS